jgi:hypothetical protein
VNIKEKTIKLINPIKLFTFLLFCFTPIVVAVDTIKLLKPLLVDDKRSKHKNEVIIRALQITAEEFGPFIFEPIEMSMTPKRAFISLKRNQNINAYIGPSDEAWGNEVITIKIPIRQGLLNYRLLLVHQSQLALFSKVKNLDDLSQLNAGLQHHWATTKVFESHGLKVTTTHNFEGLFQMLKRSRFDYIPRAIYEAYDELESRQPDLKNIVVEPTLALYLPMATHIYISPQEPRIARRLEIGLRKLIANGEIKTILDKYYAEDISRANLKNRRIIKISNPTYRGNNIENNQ